MKTSFHIYLFSLDNSRGFSLLGTLTKDKLETADTPEVQRWTRIRVDLSLLSFRVDQLRNCLRGSLLVRGGLLRVSLMT